MLQKYKKLSKYTNLIRLSYKYLPFLLALLVIFLTFIIVYISYYKSDIEIDNAKYEKSISTQVKSNLSSSNSFPNWKTYTNNKYGFEFKYPPSSPIENRKTEATNKQYVTVNNGYDFIAISPEFSGIGFEDPKTTTKTEPLLIADKQLTITGNTIEKIRVTTTHPKITETWFLITIPYPDKRDYAISVSYRFLNGITNESSEKLFDQIVSTFNFFDPGEDSTLNQTGVTNFSSKYLNLSFKYPSMWGQIEEKIMPGQTGKTYNLSFDGNVGGSALGFGNIMAGGRSKDYTEGRGGYVVDAANGFSTSQEFCSSYYGKQGINCDQVNPNTISQLVAPKYLDYCPSDIFQPPNNYSFSKRVWVNLSGQAVDGFMMQYSNFWSKDFVEMSSPDLDCSKTNQQKFDSMVAKIVDKINNGEVDEITKSNIDGFDDFVRSIKIN